MYRNRCRTCRIISMDEPMMTAADPNGHKPGFLKSAHHP